MSKSLEERLRDAKTTLGKVEAVIQGPGRTLLADVKKQFLDIIAFRDDIDHCISMLHARGVAWQLLTELEMHADDDDCVPFGASPSPVKFQHARFLAVQSYITSKWALADRITSVSGRVVCTPEVANDWRSVQLVTGVMGNKKSKPKVFALLKSVRQTYGWPIGISYAIRNHFVHEGAQLDGVGFFAGPTAHSSFQISPQGWERIERKAREYEVIPDHCRLGGDRWPPTPPDDLRDVLRICEQEMDDALGVLLGSACHFLHGHAAFLLGEI